MVAMSGQKHHFQRRHNEEQHDGADQHAAHDHRGQRTLHLAADAGGNRRRKQTDAGREARHQQRPHPGGGGVKHGIRGRTAAKPGLVVIGDQQNAVHDRHAEQRDETDGGGDAEIEPGDVKRQHAAGDGEGNARKASAGTRAAN